MTVINIRIEVQNDDGSKELQEIIIPAKVVADEEEQPKVVVDEVVITEKKKFERSKPIDTPTYPEVSLDEIRMWATSAIESKLGDQLKEIMDKFGIKKLSDAEARPEIKKDLLESISGLTKTW